MIGRLRIELSAVDGSAAGDTLHHDMILDVSDHRIVIDQNGQVFVTISGRIPHKRSPQARAIEEDPF